MGHMAHLYGESHSGPVGRSVCFGDDEVWGGREGEIERERERGREGEREERPTLTLTLTWTVT